jgi:hypothetical protein
MVLMTVAGTKSQSNLELSDLSVRKYDRFCPFSIVQNAWRERLLLRHSRHYVDIQERRITAQYRTFQDEYLRNLYGLSDEAALESCQQESR